MWGTGARRKHRNAKIGLPEWLADIRERIKRERKNSGR